MVILMSTANEPDLRDIGFYFYFPEREIHPEFVNCTAMAIADGLTQLGFKCYSNVGNTLFTEKPLKDAARHFVVFEVTEKNDSKELMGGISEFKCRGKLINSASDCTPVMVTPENVASIVLHENRLSPFRQKRYPWGFGLTSARLAKHAAIKPFSQRRLSIVRNFRASASQAVRDVMDIALLPLLEKHFEIDRSVSFDRYADQLAGSVGCLAYGGTFVSELTKNPAFRNSPSIAELAENRSLLKESIVIRWDSYRFWESLAAGCLTFNLDLNEYGFLLPEMPRAWEHYIPLNFSDLKGSVSELMDRRGEWEAIAAQGRTWAITHYSPIAAAQRFLGIARAELPKS